MLTDVHVRHIVATLFRVYKIRAINLAVLKLRRISVGFSVDIDHEDELFRT